jgi:hypothetical protein
VRKEESLLLKIGWLVPWLELCSLQLFFSSWEPLHLSVLAWWEWLLPVLPLVVVWFCATIRSKICCFCFSSKSVSSMRRWCCLHTAYSSDVFCVKSAVPGGGVTPDPLVSLRSGIPYASLTSRTGYASYWG